MTIPFRQRIMMGVYMIYLIRKLKNPFVSELFIISIFFTMLSFFVSLPHIFSNILLTKGSYNFLVDAFLKTDTTVKLILLSTVIAGLFFIKNISLYTTNFIKTRFA